MFKKLVNLFRYYVLGKKYYRIGECRACGRCCERIYVKHGKNVLTDEEVFYKLINMHKFYADLDLIGKDETGLIFACKNLDKQTRKCKIHKMRPEICRKYPQEELFKMGGDMAQTCGYKFIPIFSFEEILNKTRKQKRG